MSMKLSKAFTLIELLIVIVIIGILFIFTLPRFASIQAKARNSVRQKHIQEIHNLLVLYYNDHGVFPDHLGMLSPQYTTSLPIDPKVAQNNPCLGFIAWAEDGSNTYLSSGFYHQSGRSITGHIAQNGYLYGRSNILGKAWIAARMEKDGSINSHENTRICNWPSIQTWTNYHNRRDTVEQTVQSGLTTGGKLYIQLIQP